MVKNGIIRIEDLNLWFDDAHILIDVNMTIRKNIVTAIMGPSGCGKSTFLRCLNRMNDLIPESRVSGKVYFDDVNIYRKNIDLYNLRKRIGMVFQKPNPFAKSVFDNISYGLKIHGMKNRSTVEEKVVKSLKDANLWDEVKDKLNSSAFDLSGGQQQRLCIARALAIEPEVLLLDEPASALDPISTAKLEELIDELKEEYTVVIVTHNLQQAARVSQYTAFLMMGELVEYGDTDEMFTNPQDERTENYLRGVYG